MFDVNRLLDPSSYPHPVSELHLMETHISLVVLTGLYAYKLKKTCKFSFVDYSTLELRHQNCLKELELNRRQAAELYLDVVPIFQQLDGSLRVGEPDETESDSKPIVEYAVKMRQFSQDAILAAKLQHGELSPAAIQQLGFDIANFHQAIETVDPSLECVQLNHILEDALENIQLLQKQLPPQNKLQPALERLLSWTRGEFARCREVFQQRLSNGFVRRCHGDMHLNNLIQLNGKILAFDCIEFNEEFQWIDVMSDLAFPVMDLMAAGRADLGWRLLNAYLEPRDDWQGMEVFRFYAVYRAMVRAKVHWLDPSRHQETGDAGGASSAESHPLGLEGEPNLTRETDPAKPPTRKQTLGESGPWDRYVELAVSITHPDGIKLAITHGLSGSGKSTRALEWIDQVGGLRLRSDVERRRVSSKRQTASDRHQQSGADANEGSGQELDVGQETYSIQSRERVYEHLQQLAQRLLELDYSVVVDATFLKRHQRDRFRKLTADLQIAFEILVCAAPLEELQRRIAQRQDDPSEATGEVLQEQVRTCEPVGEDEC